jgi:hypothetical protein
MSYVCSCCLSYLSITVEHFGLPVSDMPSRPCLWTMQERKQIELGMPTEKNSLFTLRKEVWLLFEDPSSSFTAKLISIWSMIVILVGVSAFIAETHPSFRVKSEYDEDKVYYGVTAYTVNQAFSAVETTVIVFFTAELLLRFLATAKKIYFWQQLINWIDLVAIAPFYFDILGLKGGNVGHPPDFCFRRCVLPLIT